VGGSIVRRLVQVGLRMMGRELRTSVVDVLLPIARASQKRLVVLRVCRVGLLAVSVKGRRMGLV